MIADVLAILASFVIAVISSGGYPGLVLLMALVSAGVPIPSEIIMPFAGYLVAQGKFSLIGATLAAVIGENIGAATGYEIGRRGGRPVVARYGRYFLVGTHHLDIAERFFARWGSVAVLIGRMLPVVRAFVAIPAGLGAMNRVKFHIYTSLGSIVWCGGLAWLGMVLGDKWNSDPRVKAAFHSADMVIVAVLVLGIVSVLWIKFGGRRAGH